MKQWVEVQDQSAIAVVRRAARSLAARHDWPKLKVDELAIVATEATTNILRYAEKGRVLIDAPAEGKGGEIVMIFTDRGPGISDMDHMFQDGMSSGDSAGLGLGAIRRLSTGFDIFSGPEVGTTIVCSFAKEAPAPPMGSRPWACGSVTRTKTNAATIICCAKRRKPWISCYVTAWAMAQKPQPHRWK